MIEALKKVAALQRFDLNLLLTFDLLMALRSTTKVAEALHKTQPAVSRDLKRLRELFSDELLVKHKNQLIPTDHAIELQSQISASLVLLNDVIGMPRAFTPATITKEIRIGLGSFSELLLSEKTAGRIRAEAPGATTSFESVHGHLAHDQIDAEQYDLVISTERDIPSRFCTEVLLESQRVAVVGNSHPFAGKKKLVAADFQKTDWLAFSQPKGTATSFNHFFGKMNERIDFSLFLSNYGNAPFMLMSGKFAATMPVFAARLYQSYLPVSLIDLPKALQPVRFSMIWTRRQETSFLHRWLRDVVRSSI